MKAQMKADILLLIYSLIMGITGVVLKLATQELDIFNFIALRFALAFFVSFVSLGKHCILKLNRQSIKHSFLLGIVTYMAHVTCTAGIASAPVSIAGFLTSLQTIMVPVLAFLFMGRRYGLRTVLCVCGSFFSILLLTADGSFQYSAGIWICLSSSALAGAQILLIEKYLASGDDPVVLTVVPLGVMALCALLVAVPVSGLALPEKLSGWFCIFWTGIVSTAIASYIQALAQRYTSAVNTGIIFASIPVFTMVGGWLVFKESITVRALIGAVVLIGSIVIMELGSSEKVKLKERNTDTQTY